MTDRELLKNAAKAAGYWVCEPLRYDEFRVCLPEQHHLSFAWNPLIDDGDALRLAVKLKMEMSVDFDRVDVTASESIGATEYLYELPSPTDPLAATRRAIVRAAAEIGRTMK